jgi:hypothetical protein
MVRLLVLGVTLLSGVALAAPGRQTTGGGGCCSLFFVILFTYIYRSGGTDWLRSIGAAMFPGIFGWFIWRDRDLGGGARWTAVIMASLHAFFFLLGVVVVLAAPAVLKKMNAVATNATSEETTTSTPVDLTNVKEDPSLGLHPPAFITSDPVGAKVSVNGEPRGKTPLETPLGAGERNEVKVELEGYFSEMRAASPNARERLNLNFTLKSAALLKVTTEPPGARVLVAMKEVLAKTPGTTQPVEAGPSEVLVMLAGHQPHVQTMELGLGETELAVTLQPGVKIAVTSTPEQAEVFVDGRMLGITPLDVYVSAKGKHTVEVKKDPWAPAKKVFTSVPKPTVFAAKLVDTERMAAQQAVARARARYDKVNAELEKLQFKIEHLMNPPPKLERQRAKLEADMEKAAGALEQAEGALRAIEDTRGPPPTPKEDPDD